MVLELGVFFLPTASSPNRTRVWFAFGLDPHGHILLGSYNLGSPLLGKVLFIWTARDLDTRLKLLPFPCCWSINWCWGRWKRTGNSTNGSHIEIKMQDILAFSLSLDLQLNDFPWNISVMKTFPKRKSFIFIDGRVWCKNKWICKPIFAKEQIMYCWKEQILYCWELKYGAINHGAWLAPFWRFLLERFAVGPRHPKEGPTAPWFTEICAEAGIGHLPYVWIIVRAVT